MILIEPSTESCPDPPSPAFTGSRYVVGINFHEEELPVPVDGFDEDAVTTITPTPLGPAQPVSRIINHVALPALLRRHHVRMLVRVRRRKEIHVRARKDAFRREVSPFLDVDVFEKVAKKCAAEYPAPCFFLRDLRKIEERIGDKIVMAAVKCDDVTLERRDRGEARLSSSSVQKVQESVRSPPASVRCNREGNASPCSATHPYVRMPPGSRSSAQREAKTPCGGGTSGELP